MLHIARRCRRSIPGSITTCKEDGLAKDVCELGTGKRFIKFQYVTRAVHENFKQDCQELAKLAVVFKGVTMGMQSKRDAIAAILVIKKRLSRVAA